MKYLIIGSSSGLGRAIAYKFANEGHDLIIASRDSRDLTILKKDLEYKYSISVKIIEIDVAKNQDLKVILNNKKIFKQIDGILFPIGLISENDNINLELNQSKKIVYANFYSIALIASEFCKNKKTGLIVGFGSVAGYLGRDINAFYSASKMALETFFESLAFANKDNKIKVQFYISGYLNTNMSYNKIVYFPKGKVKKFAEEVYKNRTHKFKKKIFPKWWSIIIIILKLIPKSLLIKLKFN